MVDPWWTSFWRLSDLTVEGPAFCRTGKCNFFDKHSRSRCLCDSVLARKAEWRSRYWIEILSDAVDAVIGVTALDAALGYKALD